MIKWSKNIACKMNRQNKATLLGPQISHQICMCQMKTCKQQNCRRFFFLNYYHSARRFESSLTFYFSWTFLIPMTDANENDEKYPIKIMAKRKSNQTSMRGPDNKKKKKNCVASTKPSNDHAEFINYLKSSCAFLSLSHSPFLVVRIFFFLLLFPLLINT